MKLFLNKEVRGREALLKRQPKVVIPDPPGGREWDS